MSRGCARRTARRSSPTMSPTHRTSLVEHLERHGAHRLCHVEHAGIRRRRQHLQRGFRAHAQSVEYQRARRRARPAARRWRWRPAWRGWRMAPTWAARCAIRRASAASSACGHRPAGWRSAPRGKIDGTLGVEGPMARNVEDLALLLDAMAGAEPARSSVAAGATAPASSPRRAAALHPKRVAVQPRSRHHAGRSRSREDRRGGGAAARERRRRSSRKRIPTSREAHECFQVLRALLLRDRAQADLLDSHRDQLKPEVVWNIEKGLKLTGRRYRARRSAARSPCSSACVNSSRPMTCCCARRPSCAPFPVEQRYVAELRRPQLRQLCRMAGHRLCDHAGRAARRSRSRPASPARTCRSACRSSRRRRARQSCCAAPSCCEDILDLGAITADRPAGSRGDEGIDAGLAAAGSHHSRPCRDGMASARSSRARSKDRSIATPMATSTAAPGALPVPARNDSASPSAMVVVATMAWNTHRHLEIWYGLMGLGAVVHTLNPRLFADQLDYIINHAEDRWIFLDLTFVPTLREAQPAPADGQGLRRHDRSRPYAGRRSCAMPSATKTCSPRGPMVSPGRSSTRTHACGMCYTSRHHRQSQGRRLFAPLQRAACAWRTAPADALALSSRDTLMPVVPMFHANAWSLAFRCPDGGRQARPAGAEARRRFAL